GLWLSLGYRSHRPADQPATDFLVPAGIADRSGLPARPAGSAVRLAAQYLQAGGVPGLSLQRNRHERRRPLGRSHLRNDGAPARHETDGHRRQHLRRHHLSRPALLQRGPARPGDQSRPQRHQHLARLSPARICPGALVQSAAERDVLSLQRPAPSGQASLLAGEACAGAQNPKQMSHALSLTYGGPLLVSARANGGCSRRVAPLDAWTVQWLTENRPRTPFPTYAGV